MLDKIKRWARLAGLSIAYGMKGADDVISSQIDPKNASTINQSQSRGGVFQELLEEEETQRVKELRDEYYRVLRAAENIHVDVDPSFMKEDWNEEIDGNKLYATARKKSMSDLLQHAKVYDADGLPIKVIQDNLHIAKKSIFSADSFDFSRAASSWDSYDYEVLLDVKRDTFTPTFKIEKLVKKIVVKQLDNNHSLVELYVPSDAPQFSPKGSIVINKMKTILESKRYQDQLLDASGFYFVTEKPWTDKGSHSSEIFEYSNARVKDIVVYDGSFIVRYECDIVREYEFIGDKYKMAEVDEKYNSMALKEGKIPTIGAIERRESYLQQKENNKDENITKDENRN